MIKKNLMLLLKIFFQYDTNQNECKWIRKCIRSFSISTGSLLPDDETIKQVFSRLNKNSDGGLSLDEFKEFIKFRPVNN